MTCDCPCPPALASATRDLRQGIAGRTRARVAVGAPASASAAVGATRLRAAAAACLAFPPPPEAAAEAALLHSLGGGTLGGGGFGLLLRLGMKLLTAPPGLRAAEVEEVTRRRSAWAFYLLRNPLFFTVVKPVADRTVRATAWVPVLNVVVAYAADVLRFASEHHYYVPRSPI